MARRSNQRDTTDVWNTLTKEERIELEVFLRDKYRDLFIKYPEQSVQSIYYYHLLTSLMNIDSQGTVVRAIDFKDEMNYYARQLKEGRVYYQTPVSEAKIRRWIDKKGDSIYN